MSLLRCLTALMALALALLSVAPTGRALADEPPPGAPTYSVFATREGLVGHRTANGHRIQPRDRFVALPSWRVLSSRGGGEFQVRVTYRDRSVVLPVWDVGPWNTDDDYWSPQRRYSDLPTGMPMAQAAYGDGYHDGRDQFGRRIRSPNGIDIADGAFWDDLGMTESDWVQVTFLWLGSDPGGSVVDMSAAPPAEQIAVEPEAQMVDNGAEGYGGVAAVTWYEEGCGLNGQHAWTYSTLDPVLSENQARWSAMLPGAGFYEVLAYIPACGRPATHAARYRVIRGDVASEVVVDQGAAAGTWASLGVYYMAGGSAAVELGDLAGDDGLTVRFDAVKWVPRADTTPPDARVIEALPQADGSLLVRWSGADNASGLAAYDVQVRRLPDGGWSDWLAGATVGEALFVPPEPGAYAFRARARDWAGNQQPWREADDIQLNLGT